MNLFKNIFGTTDASNPAAKINWQSLTTVGQLDALTDESFVKPLLIFKHSTRCGISRMVLKRFENEFALEDKVTPYFLDLLSYRAVSDAVSQTFNVPHESPQLLLIEQGLCTYSASHERIDAALVQSKLK